MAEKIHPGDSPPAPVATKTTPPQPSNDQVSSPKPSPPLTEKPVPQPGTYVIQIPKDQVYRVPPPENSRRYQQLTRQKPRRSRCCCCLCTFLAIILVLIVLAGVTAGILYLVFRPEAPDYSVESVSIKGFNLTTSLSPLSPEFDVTVRARNPNDKMGIFYEKGSSVNVFNNDVRLASGVLPVFFQPTNNVTVFVTALTGSSIELTSAVQRALLDAQRKGNVPFMISLRAPVKIKIGSVKTWTITVKVDCDVSVDKLTAASKVVSKHCDYGVNLW